MNYLQIKWHEDRSRPWAHNRYQTGKTCMVLKNRLARDTDCQQTQIVHWHSTETDQGKSESMLLDTPQGHKVTRQYAVQKLLDIKPNQAQYPEASAKSTKQKLTTNPAVQASANFSSDAQHGICNHFFPLSMWQTSALWVFNCWTDPILTSRQVLYRKNHLLQN